VVTSITTKSHADLTLHFRMRLYTLPGMTTPSLHAPAAGWVLVSNNADSTLEPTGVVHHSNGCRMSNGRNKLFEVPAAETANMAHCMRCEAVLGISDAPVARPSEGTKVEVRLPADILAEIDRRARSANRTRAAKLRSLISAGLASEDR
jgi:hypothetical protein